MQVAERDAKRLKVVYCVLEVEKNPYECSYPYLFSPSSLLHFPFALFAWLILRPLLPSYLPSFLPSFLSVEKLLCYIAHIII